MEVVTKSKPPLRTAVNSGPVVCWPARDTRIDSLALPAAQAAFLARIGLDATRARLTAELAWGRP